MPKNKGGKRKSRARRTATATKRELILKEEGQEYARVEKLLGGGRLTGACYDGKTRLCIIRGTLMKRVWIRQGDIILVGLREYEDGKADVIHKYNPDEARVLKAKGELPNYAQVEGEKNDEEDDCVFEFDDI
mmetsp:Transcript_27743/g.38590  ORF Transcript_27743/g.38590 Transcript_27743/m.38590 type:complete len:132 (+) Transcript_27743:111-506(+)|eukprot:CAMPEP_0184486772 /NCGR_PEP_ID=MMETSP0113_2-20130426/8584_1 /TAXON_ID=91329 /ORGANISM="Norrisiella sphaerica, Strain BC52" /LENGTH=131 /DNA_ID=CAMNT_0026868809 /DNA_START=96 /DNA_END=491 /DNA_ORIENTATION=+